MDSIDNMYLFWDIFDEKVSKVVTSKQKSKSLLTDLHGQKKQSSSSSYCMDSQPFQQSPLHQHQQSGRGRGFLFASAANKRGKFLFKKSKFLTAELRGAKSNFISQDTSDHQKLDNTEGSKGSRSSREVETYSYELVKTNK